MNITVPLAGIGVIAVAVVLLHYVKKIKQKLKRFILRSI